MIGRALKTVLFNNHSLIRLPVHNWRFCLENLYDSSRFQACLTGREPQFCLSQARFLSSVRSSTFMEVVKAASRQGSLACDSIAIRADEKSYSYTQIVSSALRISRLLGSNGLNTDISMVLSTEDYHEVMQNVASKSAAQFSLIPLVPNVSSEMTTHDHSEVEETDADRGEDPALIVYTSGTTGKPKGVVHTHRSITAQVEMLAEAWEYSSTDQFLHCLPLHHVHGLFNALFAPLYAGAMVEFMSKFSVRGIWQRWRESYPLNGIKSGDAITVFTGVPTMYTRLIQGYEAMDTELQTASGSAARQLRLMMCGSSALPLPVMQQWKTITGHRLLERYGMTEFVMAISNPLRGERKPGTVGKPFPGVEVKIAEDESGSDAVGVGELCVKSPSLFKEYWKLPEATKNSFTDDGFFKTGDTGKVDEDGYFIILGRTNADIMKVGGYKLSALEIESVILEHPVVAECCVLGLPDKDYGDAVSVIIVPDEEAKKKQKESAKPVISLEELCTWAKDKLAPYKLPTRLFLWNALPRNAMGKVNKKELKNRLAADQ
ncbi:probable CoA ligase CCL8 isoform X4 [Mangifera indica]|uniref:probable CoA ligase CCL8 isoform X4 n=1 Tax=Mangifera indica TaxID=29780 RepID=UPI001CFB636C|nr:probable CoA ligase CCL8 isoform X4 [Mangifera indica]